MDATWIDIGPASQIEPGTARTLPVTGGEEIAVFHTLRGEVYALVNKCPHKQGPLSQGIVHGDSVSCPLHNWRISLKTGQALGEDEGCTPTIPLKVDAGRIYLDRSAVLGGTPRDAVKPCPGHDTAPAQASAEGKQAA